MVISVSIIPIWMANIQKYKDIAPISMIDYNIVSSNYASEFKIPLPAPQAPATIQMLLQSSQIFFEIIGCAFLMTKLTCLFF